MGQAIVCIFKFVISMIILHWGTALAKAERDHIVPALNFLVFSVLLSQL